MALEMKATSRWWYGRFVVQGRLRRFPLMETRGGKLQRIEIKGRRPSSLKHPEDGDAAFVASYHRARAAHDRLLEEEMSRKSIEDLAQRIIVAKTGSRLDFVKVEAVAEAWTAIPRKRQPSRQYIDTAKGKLRRFADFMSRHYPNVEDLAEVRADHVRAFLDEEAARGVSARTWNVMLKLLKTVFAKLEPNADAHRAFLRKAVVRDEDTIHREPFKKEESDAIIEAARTDDVLHGPIVTALCTGMRRGDCCLLKWSSVDLAAGFVAVRTSKTGEPATIPILTELREELARTRKTRSECVFPRAAEFYLKDPHALDRRLKGILERAGFVDSKRMKAIDKERHRKPQPGEGMAKLPKDELRRRGLEVIAAGDMIESKRNRMKAIFTAYVEGKGLPTIARELGVSKSTVSLHLHAVENMTGVAVIRRPAPTPVPAVIRGELHAKNGNGPRLKRGSVRGWHSFRVAFVTRALSAGMPEELVRRMTGHTTVDVVRKHYFKPGREEFRREFEKAMPGLLMNGAKSRDEQMREIIERVKPKTWKKDKAQLLALLDGKA